MVVKLYRRPPSVGAGGVLTEMVAWSAALAAEQRAQLHWMAAWPTALVRAGERPVGIAMHDVSGRFEVPFLMPSGRRERVLLSLEHLLGDRRVPAAAGLGVRLDTFTRAEVAERICEALAFLHRHGIVASDIAPNNLLVAFGAGDEPEVCFIDCDSMVFHGRQALAAVETADWQIPAAFAEPPRTRAADAYKLGLVVLRLFARSHDARAPAAAPPPRADRTARAALRARSLPTRSNRPPAGEWQRALRGLLADGRLNERYPGRSRRRGSAPVAASAARRSRRVVAARGRGPGRARGRHGD